MFGTVITGSFTINTGGIDWDLIRHDIKTQLGDSGAPMGDADASHILGINKGHMIMGSNVYYVATA